MPPPFPPATLSSISRKGRGAMVGDLLLQEEILPPTCVSSKILYAYIIDIPMEKSCQCPNLLLIHLLWMSCCLRSSQGLFLAELPLIIHSTTNGPALFHWQLQHYGTPLSEVPRSPVLSTFIRNVRPQYYGWYFAVYVLNWRSGQWKIEQLCFTYLVEDWLLKMSLWFIFYYILQAA